MIMTGLGRRVREWVNGAETRQWIWDGLELCEERSSTNNVTKRFYGQGEQISGVAYYSTRDHLGSVQELLDGSGSLAAGGLHARYSYDVYGQRSANLVTLNPVASDFGFTGHQEFDAIGLLGAPLRFYQPPFGRWLCRDPIEEDGGINLYAYVRNAPTFQVDPLGLDPTWGMYGMPMTGPGANGAAIAATAHSNNEAIEKNALNQSLRPIFNSPFGLTLFGVVQSIWGGKNIVTGGTIAGCGTAATADIPVIGQVAGPAALAYGLAQIVSGFKNIFSGLGNTAKGLSGQGANIVPPDLPIVPMAPSMCYPNR
jgi:RHS repeat-associated protein